MNCFKTVLRTPVKNGTIARNPFDDFPPTQKHVYRNYLELEEIKKLQQLECLNKDQELKRDLFLFACFAGMVYPDIKGLKGSDFVTNLDRSICIRDPVKNRHGEHHSVITSFPEYFKEILFIR